MIIDSTLLTIDAIESFLKTDIELSISAELQDKITACREYLDKKVKDGNLYYGINTGFGSLCDVAIANDELNALQENLVMSHACGMGEEVPQAIVRIMLLLKIRSLSYGHSGVQLATVQRLVDFYNQGIYPVVYTEGSLGASGDLAPLAHLALPLIGKGEVNYQGKRYPGEEMLKMMNWEPIQLQSKEGLALLNGTQFMSAYGVYLVMKAKELWRKANFIAAASIDGFACRMEPFNALVHQVRPHEGQIQTAQQIRSYLADSNLAKLSKKQVQDPYSFRCIPQVHGASYDAIMHVTKIMETEINSVTDNPNVFPEEDKIISAGNFHGQTLAIHIDFLKLAISELGNISERRIYLMMSGQRDLSAYLSPKPGLHSGFMIAQYTAASIASKNKQLCSPASADSIPSSNGQEDHVSMGANAAVQAYQLLENVFKIIGIEWLVACQALSFRDEKSATKIQEQLSNFRKEVAPLNEDRVLHNDLLAATKFVQEKLTI